MSAWHDRVGDLTLFEALTGGAFDHLNWQHSGVFDHFFFQKSQMPRGLPGRGGGEGGFGIDRYITLLSCQLCRSLKVNVFAET